MSRTPLWLLALLALCVLLAPGNAFATDFFVDAATGNNGNNGLTEGTAWATLQRALSTLVAGDTVFVKNGTYNSDPATLGFETANAGTPSQPIAIRAFGSGPTRHHPVVTRTPTTYNLCFNNPAVQCENDVVIHVGRNHVIWDGFTLGPFTSIRTDNVCRAPNPVCAAGVIGAIFENLTIDKGPAQPHQSQFQFGNYDAFFLNFSSNIIIRNNAIRNVFYLVNGVLNNHQNASGIVLFDTENVQVRNNRISGCNTGIFDKRNSVNNVHELNYITDSNSKGFLLTAFTAFQCGNTCPVTGLRVRQNIITNALQGINLNLGSGTPGQTIDDIRVHNNVFFNTGEVFRVFGNIPNLWVYNNVLHLDPTKAVSPLVHYAYSADPATVFPPSPGFVSNFSSFSAASGFQDRFRADEFGGSEERIAAWRARGVDLNSLVGDPMLVGPLTGSPPPTAFMLQAGSPLRLAGRVDGVSGGAAVNIGAYITDTELIGTAVDLIAPSPPTNPAMP